MKTILIWIILVINFKSVLAGEYPIGKPVTRSGMEIGAVYLHPIEMDPPKIMRPIQDSDIHLEADIHAASDNQMGFPEGDWVPYLTIKYELQKIGSQRIQKGTFMPMIANDGPHYGDNIKLEGVGKYKLKYIVFPPNTNEINYFGRHIDKETGVNSWFKPLEVFFEFIYAGTGKKGGY